MAKSVKERELLLQVKVTAPTSIPDKMVVRLVNMLLDVGFADATESANLDDIDSPEAKLVMKLQVSEPVIASNG